MTTPTAAVANTQPSNDDITSILRGMGMLEAPRSEFNRVRVDGGIFYFGDEPFVSNPKTGAPAFTARIIDAPAEYQSLWMDSDTADFVGRPHMAGKFCKSHFDKPAEAREHAEDGTACRQCPLMPFIKAADVPSGMKKCQWKGDLRVQLVDPTTGTLVDEKVWTITLPTTAMIEWKGTSRDGVGGNVSPENFIHKLAKLGMTTGDGGEQGVRKAINALALGAIVAEFRGLSARSEDKSRTWTVISVTPTAILDVNEPAPAIEAGDPAELSNIPF